tara:strand:+ start:1986 stop:2243 length:258 start_codon:yes stop_codon:yes gene_type:complete
MVDNNNETQVPSITIGGVQISVDELPEGDARRWFAQVQHLTQKKAGQVFDLERTQVAIDGFVVKLVATVNKEGEELPTESDKDSK